MANSRAGLLAWGVDPRKGRVVYNAFDPDRLDAAGSSERSARVDGATTVVMTGRMVADKDFSTVIAAARLLDRERPGRWRFVLLGHGPDRRRLVDEAGRARNPPGRDIRRTQSSRCCRWSDRLTSAFS